MAKAIVASDRAYHAGVAVARRATETLDELPEGEKEFVSAQLAMADALKLLPAGYGL